MRKARQQKVLAVVGSQLRYWPTHLRKAARATTEGIVLGCGPFEYDGKVITGNATGVDTWVYEVCVRYGVNIEQYFPKNNRWEPGGYKERNIRIGDTCTELVVIYYVAGTHGGGWSADYAESIGKKVTRIEIR